MINVISSFGDLIKIKDEIVSFYKEVSYAYFLSPEYCFNSYKSFHSDEIDHGLYFIVNREKQKIVGYIPLVLNKKGILKFINDSDTDFLSEVGCFSYNDYKKIIQDITTNTMIKRIDLNNFPIDAKFPHYLKHFLGLGTVIYGFNNHSYLQSQNEVSLIKHLSSSGRSELKRIVKKNADFEFKIFKNNIAFPKEKLIKLRSKMIENGSRNSNFFSDKLIDFVENLYIQQEIEIFTNNSEDRFVSASIVLKNETSKKMIWMDLYDDEQYINLSAYIEYIHILDEGNNNYLNFGRGSYDYKAKNFQPKVENLYNLRYSKSKWDFFFTNYYPIKEFIKRIIKSTK